ncbi:DUF3667 domain-containing protein [Pontibacter fetidus]|uniref:DUF3667 domain-containing protein n=1 Tax=Pontibacter fetidus TaxID=2700082 RepID=A0A6B2H8N4_9BACT|nr:DUF3667 domain-containing protein [Pontibacter fetidus]NDK56977.1 DUF3667 domain-containing protein [Pontibacter fetidus]
MKKHYRSENNCLNCGTTVTDKFCPSCGQENLELHESFFHLLFHSVGHYFHFESKFFNSMVPLLTKPGYLTKEYFAGKRASHLNPISMYISISIVFFFLFTANSNNNKKDILKEKEAEEELMSKAEEFTGKKTLSLVPKAQAATDTSANSKKTIPVKNPEADIEVKDKIAIGGWEIPIAGLNTKFREVKHDKLKNALFKNKLVSHLPKMMFILLPLFALILKLVNYRSKKFYTEHLIYSIHVHSFLFLFGSILIILDWLLPFLDGWITLFGLSVIVWYIYRSMRNTYKGSRWATVSKFMMLALAYSFLMLLSGLIVVLATLYTI